MATLSDYIQQIVRQQRGRLLRNWQSESTRLSRTYTNLWIDIQADAELLSERIEDGEFTIESVKRSRQYKALLTSIIVAIGGYQALLLSSARDLQTMSIDLSHDDILQLVRLQSPNMLFRQIPKDALAIMADYLEKGSPLWERIDYLSRYGADTVSQAILDSIRTGSNATITARNIRKAFSMPLTDSLRITRTVTAWSYREANRLQYIINPQAVSGWQWFSALEPGRTCMSCVNMHGTIHSPDEVLEDHHNGLCTSVPIAVGEKPPLEQTGEQWYEAQSEAVQRRMMGNGMYEQWQEGNIAISDMTTPYQDEVYGQMLRQSTLKDLIGN